MIRWEESAFPGLTGIDVPRCCDPEAVGAMTRILPHSVFKKHKPSYTSMKDL